MSQKLIQFNDKYIYIDILAIDQLIWERRGRETMLDTLMTQNISQQVLPKLEPDLRNSCQLSRVKTEHPGNTCMDVMETMPTIENTASGPLDYSNKQSKFPTPLDMDVESKVKQLALSVTGNSNMNIDNSLLNTIYNNGVQTGIMNGDQMLRGNQFTYGQQLCNRLPSLQNMGKLTRANLSSYDSHTIGLKQKVEDYLIELDATQAYTVQGKIPVQKKASSEGSTGGSADGSTRGSGAEGHEPPKQKSKRGRKPGQCEYYRTTSF